MSSEQTWDYKVVCEVADVNVETLRKWGQLHDLGLESEPPKGGRGGGRRYTFNDVVRIVVMSELTDLGFNASHAAFIVSIGGLVIIEQAMRGRQNRGSTPHFLLVLRDRYGFEAFPVSGIKALGLHLTPKGNNTETPLRAVILNLSEIISTVIEKMR